MHTPSYTASSTSSSVRSDPSSPSVRSSMKRERNFDNDHFDESEISMLLLSHPSSSLNPLATGIYAFDNSANNTFANANGSSAIAAAVASALLNKKTASSSSLLDGNITDDDRCNTRSPKLRKNRNSQNQRKASEMSLSSILSRTNMLDSPSNSSQSIDQFNGNNSSINGNNNGNSTGNGNGYDDEDESSSDKEEEDEASSSSTTQPWTLEEDRLLLQKQEEIGNKWAHIITFLPQRNQNQLKVRFKSILRASKREWTEQENNLLIQLHNDTKADWSIIAPYFPHRTKNAVKKHHRQLVKMRKDNLYPLPPPHGAPNQIFYDKEDLHNKIRQLAKTMLPPQNKDEKPGTSPLLNPVENNNAQSTISRFNPSPVHLTQIPNTDSKNFTTVKARNASQDPNHMVFQQQQQQQQQYQQQQQTNWLPSMYNSQQQQHQQMGVGMPVSNVSGSSFMGGLLSTDSTLDAGFKNARSNPVTTTAPSTPAHAVQQQQQQQHNAVTSTSPFTSFRSPLKARKNSKQAIVPASLKQEKLVATPDEKKVIAHPVMHPVDQSHHVHQQMFNIPSQNLYMNNYQPNQHHQHQMHQQYQQHQQQINQQQQHQYHLAMQQVPQHQQQQQPPPTPQQHLIYPPVYQQHQSYQANDFLDDLFIANDFFLDEGDDKIL